MKKIVIFVLFFVQVLWVFNDLTPPSENINTSIPTSIVELHSSVLLKIVYTNFLETLKNVIYIGYLIPSLPSSSRKNQNEETTKNKIGIHFCNQFNYFAENFKNTLNSSVKWLRVVISNDCAEFLNIKKILPSYMRIWFILLLILYLQKFQFYFLKPRSNVADVIFFVFVVIKNPNWDLGVFPQVPIRVFLFYKELKWG